MIEIKIIMDNKNDLVEETFCYQLFENRLFDRKRLLELLASIKYVKQNQLMTQEIKGIILWVVNCVDQCFVSNKDSNDLYCIQNYYFQDENNWNLIWKQEILHALI